MQTPVPQEASSAAERFFDDGLAALQREDYATALVAFERARALEERPILLYNIAMCRRALLQYPEAIAAFRHYLVLVGPEAHDERRQQVQDLIAQMEGDLARVVVRVDRDGATVLLDGERVGTTPLAHLLQLGPGRHVLEVRRDGYRDAVLPFDVMAGEAKELALALEPLVAAPPTEPVEPVDDGGIVESWWFWTLIGVVAVGGAVTAGVLLWPEDAAETAAWGTSWGF
ncbi:MAG: PEGA domain-containing protein [Deltaproteobacteria bacterium]|nr:PEGA domain-containing protein [Deltaproteobacteria bacterium]